MRTYRPRTGTGYCGKKCIMQLTEVLGTGSIVMYDQGEVHTGKEG